MKIVRKLLMACAFIAGLGTAATLMAADNLPASALGGTAKSAQDSLKRDAVCTRCHDESEPTALLTLYKTKHGVRGDSHAPNCQSCHGESEKHLKGDPNVKGRAAPDRLFKKGTYAASAPEVQNEACMACHKSGLRKHWEGSQHQAADLACTSCHKVHNGGSDPVLAKRTQPEVCFTCHKEQRAQLHRISTHPIEAGKMGCSDCHNPHGSTGPKLLIKNNVNETCYTCHAEKRGPFLWEHGPVTDDCLNCHTPHGSSNTPLLNTRVPYLCQECHSGDHGNGINSASNLTGGNALGITVGGVNQNNTAAAQNSRAQLGARACLNCHVLIHGSNHPAGAKYQR